MNNELFINKYYNKYPQYLKLGDNISEAIKLLIKEENISVANISSRIKTLKSFLQKQKRKNYSDPFNEMHDFCGIRIICFFTSDIKKIQNIIRKEFNVIEEKEKNLQNHQFGYRSRHLIVTIKDSWVESPNYRDLNNIKIEIQVRTILMHAWAEIEHKLAYKQRAHIPKQFQQKFIKLADTLQKADEQFETLATEINQRNKRNTQKQIQSTLFDQTLDLDLDTMQMFLDFYFPKQIKDIGKTRDLLDEIILSGITLKQLVSLYDKNNLAQQKPSLAQSQTEQLEKLITIKKSPNKTSSNVMY